MGAGARTLSTAEPSAPQPGSTPAAPAARGSARIGMRGGIGLARSRTVGEKQAAAARSLSRQTWRSIFIGVAVGVALYVAIRVVAVGH